MKKTQLLILGFIVLILSLIWEFSHFPLYYPLIGISKTPLLLIAGIGDLFLISLIFLAISYKNKTTNWIKTPDYSDYLLIILLGSFISILIEVISLNLGSWAYREAMPVILGIGLSPLVQLSVTSILSLFILRKISPSKSLFSKNL